jgi:hypothetical protein
MSTAGDQMEFANQQEHKHQQEKRDPQQETEVLKEKVDRVRIHRSQLMYSPIVPLNAFVTKICP